MMPEQRQSFVEPMAGHDDRGAVLAAQVFQEVHHTVTIHIVQSLRGFVENQQGQAA